MPGIFCDGFEEDRDNRIRSTSSAVLRQLTDWPDECIDSMNERHHFLLVDISGRLVERVWRKIQFSNASMEGMGDLNWKRLYFSQYSLVE